MLMQMVPSSGWMKYHTQVPVHSPMIVRRVIAAAARYIVAGTGIRLMSRQPTPTYTHAQVRTSAQLRPSSVIAA